MSQPLSRFPVPQLEALPEEAQQLVVSQLAAVVDSPGAGLGTGLVLGIAFALFAASAAMRTLTTAVGVVYGDAPGSRSYARERGRALALTLGAVGFVAAAVYVVTIVPTGEGIQRLVGADAVTADAFGVIGLIPASDGSSMTITAAGELVS